MINDGLNTAEHTHRVSSSRCDLSADRATYVLASQGCSTLFYPANFLKSTSRPQRRGVWLITLPKTCRLNVMARGVLSPAATVPLPKVSFVKVQDDVSTKPAGVHDGQARSYGCLCRLIQF